eukprot:scaffold11929_cov107-Isochrysis_galbana.AAC.6
MRLRQLRCQRAVRAGERVHHSPRLRGWERGEDDGNTKTRSKYVGVHATRCASSLYVCHSSFISRVRGRLYV